MKRFFTLAVIFAWLAGCGGDEVDPTPDAGLADVGESVDATSDAGTDASMPDMAEPAWDDISDTLDESLSPTIPSMAGVVFDKGGIIAMGAAGVRKAGGNTSVTVDDKYHIASVAQTFTSLLAARVVERGDLTWSTTPGEVFENASVDPAFEQLTLTNLLTHTSGLPQGGDPGDWERIGIPAARLQIAESNLGMPPVATVGDFSYSYIGFIVAAAMMEQTTGESWEDLMTALVFEPLGIDGCGWDHPASPNETDVTQPWPHQVEGGFAVPKSPLEGWNGASPTFRPALVMHCSVSGLAAVGQVILGGAPEFIGPSTLETANERGVTGSLRYGDSALQISPLGYRGVLNGHEFSFQHGSIAGNAYAAVFVDFTAEKGIAVVTNVQYSETANEIFFVTQGLAEDYF